MNWKEIAEQSGQFKSSPREKNNKAEAKLQRAVCEWIMMQYPHVYFTSDASSLGAGWSTIKNISATKSKHAQLDLVILHRSVQGEYSFLVLEFKRESPFLKDGTLSQEKHVQEQLKTMQLLRKQKGKCEWAWTIDMSQRIIENYLGENRHEVNNNNIMHEIHDR